MARIQILNLPGITSTGQPRFALVIDEYYGEDSDAQAIDSWAKNIGAEGALASASRIDVASNDTAPTARTTMKLDGGRFPLVTSTEMSKLMRTTNDRPHPTG